MARGVFRSARTAVCVQTTGPVVCRSASNAVASLQCPPMSTAMRSDCSASTNATPKRDSGP